MKADVTLSGDQIIIYVYSKKKKKKKKLLRETIVSSAIVFTYMNKEKVSVNYLE